MKARPYDTRLRGETLLEAPMAGLTSWHAGGRADRLYKPADLEDLCTFLRTLPMDEPVLWVGLGSNLLVRDGGVRGTVIATHGRLVGLQRVGDSTLSVGAGVPCAKLARFAAREGLAGASFFAGIPGTLGGALAMNAGAFGGETWPLVSQVETLDRYGNVFRKSPAEFAVGYRDVRSRDSVGGDWFVSAELTLEPGAKPAVLQREIRQLLSQRSETQPTGVASCGSVFRNPPGDYAGRLIEVAGLKGLKRGDAQVALQHGNFILNTGAATADDIEDLILEVQEKVETATGVRLHTEVRIVGERGDHG